MERVINYKDYKIKENRYSKKEIYCSIAFKCLIMVVFMIGLIMDFTIIGSFSRGLTYFGTLISLASLAIIFLFLILDVIRLYSLKDLRKTWLYIIKFSITVSSLFSMILVLILIFPTLFSNYEFENFARFGNVFNYLLGPILLSIDFVEFDYNYNSNRKHVYYGVIPFFVHYIIVLCLSLFTNYNWKSYCKGISSLKMPYSFYDYSLANNNWWSDELAKFSLKEGTIGVNQSFLLFIFLVILIIIGLFLLHLKNKKYIYLYKIPYTNNNFHQDI